MSETVTLNLIEVATPRQLLHLLGDVLELGGPGSNRAVRPDAESGWGQNWDALHDSLRYLDSGGIWGTSRKLDFPLSLHFVNSDRLTRESPETRKTLVEILQDVQEGYAKDGLSLYFKFEP